jgi:hypothetical protein
MIDSIIAKQLASGFEYIMKPRVSRIAYEINSVHVEPSKREYTIIRLGRAHIPNIFREYLISEEFSARIKQLRLRERAIFEQIIVCISTSQPIKERNKLVEERDSIIELLVLLCTRFCVQKYMRINTRLSPYDMLVFFATIRLFDYLLPYVKFWEIMERVGY